MTNGGDLPWELTEIIISYLSLKSLQDIALLSQTFRAEARKYMYQSFSITVDFSRDRVLHFLTHKERPDLDTAQQRFAFFASQPIATYVQSCSVEYVTKDPNFDPLIDALCAQLCHFPKLNNVSFINTHIDEQRATSIARCRPLLSLAFNSCTLSSIPKPLRHQLFTRSLSIRDTDDCPPQFWLTLVNLSELTHLQLPTQPSVEYVLEEMTSFDKIPIQTLSIDGSRRVIRSEVLTVALSKCNRLSTLEILTPSRATSLLPLPEGVVLDAFSGPHDMLKSVVETQKQLKRVRLNGMRWGNTCDIFDIQFQLPALQACAPELQAMQLRAFPTKALCTSIAKLFPKLRSLSFELPLQTQKDEPMEALTREV